MKLSETSKQRIESVGIFFAFFLVMAMVWITIVGQQDPQFLMGLIEDIKDVCK